MPIYEYRCESCGKRTSALLASFSSPDPACPHCGQSALHRMVSTFATVRSADSEAGDFGAGHEHDEFGGGEGGFGEGGDDFGGGGDDFGGGGDDFGDDY
jgi:putative FmdB family regulatory protein